MYLLKKRHLSRRTFLRGAVAGSTVALAVPILEAMLNSNGDAFANGSELPRRMITWFFGNGVALANTDDAGSLMWAPPETGANYPLTPQLAPLSDVRDYCNLVTKLKLFAKHPEVRGHHTGVSGYFSGYPYIKLDPMGANYSSKFGGPSIDQAAAAFVGSETFLPSVQLRVSKRIVTSEGPTLEFISHKGPDQPLPPIHNPQELFNKLFLGFVPPDDPTKPQRLTALDAVREDVLRLQQKVGANDKQRLQAHLASVEQVQKQIDAIAPLCEPPAMPGETNTDMEGKEPLEPVSSVMAELLALAFSCDITRVASIQFTGSVGYTVFHMLGQNKGHHDMTHEAADNAGVDASTIKMMECFAYLLRQLRDTSEGDGNLLDQSVVLLGSDCASGLYHTDYDLPCIVAGRGGGTLKYPGVHYRSNDENASDMLLACLKAVAPEATSVGGDNGYSETPLSGILA